MKRLALISLLSGGLILFPALRPAAARATVSVGFFYDELAPYGHWIDCRYGNCWAPAGVASSWQPYSNGEWVYTDYGWTWVSYDRWGADPYHYGSWVWISGDGWAWVPGTVWAPAWVSWCYDDDFIGWAPLSPAFAFSVYGYFGPAIVASSRSYVIVPANRFVGGNVSTARLPVSRNASILPRTQKATAFRTSGGIVRNTALPLSRVANATRGAISRRSISAARTDPKRISAKGSRRLSVSLPSKTLRAAYEYRAGTRPATAVRAAPGGAPAVPRRPGEAGRFSVQGRRAFPAIAPSSPSSARSRRGR